MRMHEERLGRIAVIRPYGDMDATTLAAFGARVDRLLEDGVRYLVWDLADVGVLPSTAAGFLLQAGRRMRAAGGRMVLAGLSRHIAGTLGTMGLGGIFRVFPDRAAAVTAAPPGS